MPVPGNAPPLLKTTIPRSRAIYPFIRFYCNSVSNFAIYGVVKEGKWWACVEKSTNRCPKRLRRLAHPSVGALTLYIIFASKHSTSSSSSFSLFPILIAALNSATVTRVRLTGTELLSLGSSNPPATNTFRKRFRSAISLPRSRVRYIRRLTNSSSPAASALSNPVKSPRLMHRESGKNSSWRRG